MVRYLPHHPPLLVQLGRVVDLHTAQVGSPQIGSAQVGASQHRAGEIGLAQLRPS